MRKGCFKKQSILLNTTPWILTTVMKKEKTT